jgi:mRNA interferase RelE/StbE
VKCRVRVKPAAEEELLRLAERNCAPLLQKLESLDGDPWSPGAIKLKSGHFRIIYRIDDDEKLVEVVRIARRKEDTYKEL